MIINFRQGIISAQTSNNWLQLVNGKVNINVDIEPINIAFAYGSHDYLFTEAEDVVGAWGPFAPNTSYWLYWDLDIQTGIRTYGTVGIAPSYGSMLPTNPVINQHYFDFSDKKMKVWTGTYWAEKLRVFAGTVTTGAVLTPENLGSQVGLYGNVSIGYILFDDNGVALRVTDRAGKFYFLTTQDEVHTQQDIHNAYKIDSLLMDGRAIEPIPAYHCVTWKGPKQLGMASYIDYTNPCIGISVEDFGINEIKQFVTKGFITNFNNWDFSEPANTPIFVGDTGQITTEVPQKYSLQKIGHIVSPDTVFINLQEQILIENVQVTLTPTPSITPSSSILPSPTPTPSITPTPSATPNPSGTVFIDSSLLRDFSGFNYTQISLYSTSLCVETPTPDAITTITGYSIAWVNYNGDGVYHQTTDSYCQKVLSDTGTQKASGTVDGTSLPYQNQGGGVWTAYIQDASLTDAINNNLTSAIILTITLETSLGQFTTQCSIRAV